MSTQEGALVLTGAVAVGGANEAAVPATGLARAQPAQRRQRVEHLGGRVLCGDQGPACRGQVVGVDAVDDAEVRLVHVVGQLGCRVAVEVLVEDRRGQARQGHRRLQVRAADTVDAVEGEVVVGHPRREHLRCRRAACRADCSTKRRSMSVAAAPWAASHCRASRYGSPRSRKRSSRKSRQSIAASCHASRYRRRHDALLSRTGPTSRLRHSSHHVVPAGSSERMR